MGGHLGSLSQHLVNDYKPLVENIRKLIESISGVEINEIFWGKIQMTSDSTRLAVKF